MDIKIFRNSIYRKQSASTAFYELQFCEKLLPAKKFVNYKNIIFWKENSLYVSVNNDDDEIFYNNYDKIFGQFGKLDYYGINYFTKEQAAKILDDLNRKNNLPDVETIINWLKFCVENFNGFYFLGV